MKKAIYGAGALGKKLLELFEKINIEVDAFLQTDKSEVNKINDIPVLTYHEFTELKEEWNIFIAINNDDVIDEIKKEFIKSKYNMNLVFDMKNFIIDNDVNFKLGERECILCGYPLEKFTPFGLNSTLFEEKNVVGGGYRENAICPCCGSLDHTRWIYWIIQQYTDIFSRDCTIVHFAPEKSLRKKLENASGCDYYAADICNDGKVHKIDVTQMPFKDKFADYIIINHVLEHVPNEKLAVYEMMRVLREGGKIIMSFPISLDTPTFEDEKIVTEIEREMYFGQKDHVRLYGNDYRERLEQYGLNVESYSPSDYFSKENIEKFGFIENDIAIICSMN